VRKPATALTEQLRERCPPRLLNLLCPMRGAFGSHFLALAEQSDPNTLWQEVRSMITRQPARALPTAQQLPSRFRWGPLSLPCPHSMRGMTDEVSSTSKTPTCCDARRPWLLGLWGQRPTAKTRCYRIQMRPREDTLHTLFFPNLWGPMNSSKRTCECYRCPTDTPGTMWRLAKPNTMIGHHHTRSE
jgi:hypothetical protein